MANIFDFFDEIQIRKLPSNKAFKGDFRIDPGYYSSSENVIHEIETKPLIDFCDEIFNPPVFKREFQESSDGCRYLASAEIISLNPETTFISNDQADRLNIRVRKGWILVTGFGTIGSIRIVDNIINNYAVANNVARIIPKEKYCGFLAAYLESPIGNQLLNNYAAGAVVKYIESPQISKIPVPVFEQNIVESINEKYLEAVTLREQSNDLLLTANQLVYEYNHLPTLNIADANFFDKEKVIQSRILQSNDITGEFRLDAHFYNPLAQLVIENIMELESFKKLGEITLDIIIGKRFKRNYVESDFGIPFLSGKNIIQIKPTDIKHLSTSETSFMEELLIKQNWTLITCSGTIGRTCFVYKNYEDYAASQHILRVVPNESLIDGGYLYAVLATDYGYHQLLRYRYGAVIDEIDDGQISSVLIPLELTEKQQAVIGDKVRLAYDKRAEAIRLEYEAQEILKNSLTL